MLLHTISPIYKSASGILHKLVGIVESLHNNNSLSPGGKEIDLTYCSLINANYRVRTTEEWTGRQMDGQEREKETERVCQIKSNVDKDTDKQSSAAQTNIQT